MEPDDAAIVRASVGEPERFEAIFGRHHRRIWQYLARTCGRDRADELAGDVFVAAFGQRAGYDPGRGTVVAWLYGIAANLGRTSARRRARASRALARVAGRGESVGAPADEVADSVGTSQELAVVRRALGALPDHERELISLVAWEGLTYAEVASVLGIELGTVRSRLSRARSHLRELTLGGGEETGDASRTRRNR